MAKCDILYLLVYFSGADTCCTPPPACFHSDVFPVLRTVCCSRALGAENTRIREHPVPGYKTPVFFIKPSVDHDVKVTPALAQSHITAIVHEGHFCSAHGAKTPIHPLFAVPRTARDEASIANKIDRKRFFLPFFALSSRGQGSRRFFFPGAHHPTHDGNRHCRHAARSSDIPRRPLGGEQRRRR